MDFIYKPGIKNIENTPKVLGAANPAIYKELKTRADLMRKNPTEAEQVLWDKLNKKQLGVKFRNQHVIDRFIVDFYCVEKRLAIEVDGGVHDKQKERDTERDNFLNAYGVNIPRFTNEDVLFRQKEVLEHIYHCLNSPSPL